MIRGMEHEQTYFYVHIRDVSNNVILVIHDGEGCDAFIVHQFERFLEGFVATTKRKLVHAVAIA